MVQNARQNLGAFLEIFLMKLFNLFVLNIASKGKNMYAASFLFRKTYAANNTIPQKTRLIIVHGLANMLNIEVIRSIKFKSQFFSIYYLCKSSDKIKVTYFLLVFK